jgi:predicted nucleic acid-binding protein
MSGDLIFVDTSGFVALLDADDAYHQQSSSAWQKYINEDSTLCTSDYIRLESWALIGADSAFKQTQSQLGRQYQLSCHAQASDHQGSEL